MSCNDDLGVITNRMVKVLLILSWAAAVLTGCGPVQTGELVAIHRTLTLTGAETIIVEVNAGALEISPSPTDELILDARVVHVESIEIRQSESRVEIIQTRGKNGDAYVLQVPEGSRLEVTTFSADIQVEHLTGQIYLRSTAGQVRVAGFDGTATVIAGRGQVSVADSRGDLVLISEHGLIEVREFSGTLSMSTIMGSLNYYGTENEQNVVRLEADHGPVRVDLPESVNAHISAFSTSGELACVGPEVDFLVNGCEAVVGTGVGSINIRTVSGQIEVRIAGNDQADD